jgi:hypothetical protein
LEAHWAMQKNMLYLETVMEREVSTKMERTSSKFRRTKILFHDEKLGCANDEKLRISQ